MVELVVADIGGVLVKTDEAIISCIQRAVDECGIQGGSIDAVYEVFGVSLFDYVKAYLPDGHKDRADECYRVFRDIYPQDVMHTLKPFEGVDETLRRLAGVGIRLAVLSCMRRSEVEANLSLLEFKAFDAVFALEDYGENHKRPDPAGLNAIVKNLRCRKECSIYVGDTHNDVLMGREAGLITVAVRSGAQPRSYWSRTQPDHTVDFFKDIVDEVLPNCR